MNEIQFVWALLASQAFLFAILILFAKTDNKTKKFFEKVTPNINFWKSKWYKPLTSISLFALGVLALLAYFGILK